MYIGTVTSNDPDIPTPPPAAVAVAGPGSSDDGLLLMYIYCLLPTFC